MSLRVTLPPIVAVFYLLFTSTSGYLQFEQVLAPTVESNEFVATKKATYGRPTRQRFQQIGRTRQDLNCILPGCTLMGEVLDIRGSNVTRYDQNTLKDVTVQKRRLPHISHDPSGGVLLEDRTTKRWFMMYTFERPNPGVLYRVRVRLENDTDLSSRLTIPVNFAQFGGLWKPRSSSVTPDGAMIGTEGVPPDGRIYGETKCLSDPKEFECLSNFDEEMYFDVLDFMRYFIRKPSDLRSEGKLKSSPTKAIPGFKVYRYGFPYTVSLRSTDDDRVVDDVEKLYAAGRTGAQGIAVMQDGVTIYISGGNGGFYKFEDSGTGDFTAGALYAAQLKSKSRISEIKEGSEFSIEWIRLSATSAASVQAEVDGDPNADPLSFTDIFTYSEPKGSACGPGQDYIEFNEFAECLKVKDEQLAAVFEPARLALLKGATVGVFQFAEIATRLDSDKFFIAAREIKTGVIGVGNGKDTSLIEANMCGCVFEVQMDKDYDAKSFKAILCGLPRADDEVNECDTENVANPRTLTFANNFDNLLIGEDSEHHENNILWAYDPDTGRATRIFTAPLKGSITSVNWFQDVVGGNNYIGLTIAHPHDIFGWLAYLGSFDLTSGEKLTFSTLGVPYAPGPKKLATAFRFVTNGAAEKISGYAELFRSGEVYSQAGRAKNKVKIGVTVDEKFQPVRSYIEGPGDPAVRDVEEIHHQFGFSSLIDMCGTIYSIVSTNSLPAASYVFRYAQQKRTRKRVAPSLKVENVDYIDWSSQGGLWKSGSGAVSPWNTHISGEVFEPDAIDFLGYPCLTGFSSCFKSRAEESFTESIQFVRYFGTYFDNLKNKFSNLDKIFNPYKYGYVYEVKVNKNGCVSPTKHMTLGRFSHGDLQIMPDGKTVYMTDWTEGRQVGGGLFKFIAERKNDLSAGTLYAAQFKPQRGTLQRFDVEWIRLGAASDAELSEMVDDLKFADIFDSIPSTKSCRLKKINVKSSIECIDVRKGMEKHAAFFETRRYAALKKASIELANVKGIVFDPTTAALFITINRVTPRDKIMLQDDLEGSTNNIKIGLAPCGCIYRMPVTQSQDTLAFEEFYCGSDDQGTVGSNRCDIEAIVNPKDISTIPGHSQLIVAEDSCRLDTFPIQCGHTNNALWAVQPTKVLGFDKKRDYEYTRILTVPPKSAIGSTVWYPSVGGAAYISVIINELYQDGFNQLLDPADAAAVFGVIGPFARGEADARRIDIKSQDAVCYDKDPSSTYVCPAGVKSS
eukprot:g7759.t1